MMTAQRLRLATHSVDGPPEVTSWGAAVLVGSTLAEFGRYVDLGTGRFEHDDLPPGLVARGRRRAEEAVAAFRTTGARGNATTVLTHLAIRDFGTGVLAFEMVVTEDVHELWITVTDEVADRLAG